MATNGTPQPQMRENEHPIDGVSQLDVYCDQLRQLGYLTLEQFLGAIEVVGDQLSQHLGVDVNQIVGQLPDTALAIPEDAATALTNADYALGFVVDELDGSQTSATGIDVSALPSATSNIAASLPNFCAPADVSLIAGMPSVRDQGKRGTCVAHATLSSFEYYVQNSQSVCTDLSEQFLYWNCKQNDGAPNLSGTWLWVAFELLRRDGVCAESVWPYVPDPMPGNESQAPPPDGAADNAHGSAPLSYRKLIPTAIDDIKTELARGAPVAFSIPVFDSWYKNSWVRYTGDLVMPIPGETSKGGHAMCIVGYQDLPSYPEIGGGRFIIRNSWGMSLWAPQSCYSPGYGTIPYAYISGFGKEAFSIG